MKIFKSWLSCSGALYVAQIEEEPGNEAGWNNSSVQCVLYTF